MKKVVITGGTGFIGKSLAKFLSEKGFEVVVIGRSASVSKNGIKSAQWDGKTLGKWTEELEEAAAVVNLAGKSVDCIKTKANREEILNSRIDSTKIIGQALYQCKNPPPVWVQMSTAHIYGDPHKEKITEDTPLGEEGLAPTVGKAWEKALLDYKPEPIREVRLRTSFVIGKNGGALVSLIKIARMGLGGRVGSGEQGISWIHEYDLNQIILQSIEDTHFEGAYICSAPTPVSQAEFMKTLRSVLNIPIGLPSPIWLTRLGANLVFRTDPELAIYGRYVVPKRLLNQGFQFKYQVLKTALEEIIQSK